MPHRHSLRTMAFGIFFAVESEQQRSEEVIKGRFLGPPWAFFFRSGLFPPTTGAAEPLRPCRSLSVDVTGAPVLFHFIALPTLLFLFRVHAPCPCSMIRNTIHLYLLRSSALRSAQIWSVLPSAPLVVLWFSWCVALLGSWDRFVCSAPVGASCCLPGSVALLSVLGWALLLLS